MPRVLRMIRRPLRRRPQQRRHMHRAPRHPQQVSLRQTQTCSPRRVRHRLHRVPRRPPPPNQQRSAFRVEVGRAARVRFVEPLLPPVSPSLLTRPHPVSAQRAPPVVQGFLGTVESTKRVRRSPHPCSHTTKPSSVSIRPAEGTCHVDSKKTIRFSAENSGIEAQ